MYKQQSSSAAQPKLLAKSFILTQKSKIHKAIEDIEQSLENIQKQQTIRIQIQLQDQKILHKDTKKLLEKEKTSHTQTQNKLKLIIAQSNKKDNDLNQIQQELKQLKKEKELQIYSSNQTTSFTLDQNREYLQNVKQQNQSLRTKLGIEENKYQKLEEQSRSQINQLTQQKHSLQQKIKQNQVKFDDQNLKLLHSINAEKEIKNQLNQEINNLKTKNQSLQNQILNVKDHLSGQLKEKQNLVDQLKANQLKLSQLRDQMAKKVQQFEQLSGQLQEYQKKQEQSRSKARDIQKIKQDYFTLNCSFKQVSNIKQMHEQKIKIIMEQRDNFEEKYKIKMKQVEQKHNEKLKVQKLIFQNQINSKDSEIKNQKSIIHDLQEVFQDKIKEKEDEINKLSQKIEDEKLLFELKEQEVSSLNQKVEQMGLEMAEQQTKNNEKIEAQGQKILQMQLKMQKMEQMAVQMQQTIIRQNTQIENLSFKQKKRKQGGNFSENIGLIIQCLQNRTHTMRQRILFINQVQSIFNVYISKALQQA